jgi:hypothetical protein
MVLAGDGQNDTFIARFGAGNSPSTGRQPTDPPGRVFAASSLRSLESLQNQQKVARYSAAATQPMSIASL